MTLIKTSLLNAIAVAVKMLTLLGLNKILAVYVGPAGYAAIGNFQNAVQMITTFASGAVNTGVVKYTAEYYEEEDKQRAVWRTAGTIAIIGSIITSVLVMVFRKTIALWFLKDEKFSYVFFWFSITLILFVFNTLLLAILNGKKEINRYVIANIFGSFFSLIVTSLMTVNLGVQGALIGLAIYPSFAFLITVFLCYNANWFRFSYFFGALDKNIAINLAKFTVMAMISAICVPISHIFIRNYLGDNLGWEAAGYWEAMWRLSAAYLMFVTTTLGVYYLPKLSEINDPIIIKKEIVQGYKLILPVAVACGITIYLLRDLIIGFLFTQEFTPMRELFAWQMAGDTLKIGSWILAYLMLCKAMVKIYVITEVLFCIGFFALTCLFTSILGLEGVALAHAVNYFIYWLVMGFIIPKKLKINF